MTKSAILILGIALAAIAQSQPAPEPGLLFYLSGDHGLQADYAAGGNPAPNFWNDADAALNLPANADWHGGAVTVEMTGADPEITLRNNRVELAK